MQKTEVTYTIVKENILGIIGNKIVAGSCDKTIKINKLEQVSFILPKQLIAMHRSNDSDVGFKYLIYIFRTGDFINLTTAIPGVAPKVDLLCWCYGANRVNKVLKLLEAIKSQGIDFKTLSNEYWVHQNARIQTGRVLILPG